ncbi:Fe(3+) dicitrate transport protein [Hydrobacter penzbergensis]|uniref:Fe(3+) dicitrate transport protein n=1 Tax=Hydrobacter penzbergensis TaxID=1235997 RepID=A0A8X8ICR8_9BACT|nr:TonB-dependent receptor [Hydrobacter penzbergensis]MBN8717999.1 TonB-dependent receptor [Sediminibacterium magnilacihabitans]PQV61593.1 Fe(3+) dicitrate transport protein [Sediminibacterium magnilacihabitans]SDW15949.1 Fe(3+) dicitrate transport protein [Hydrobacter penzbergensis]
MRNDINRLAEETDGYLTSGKKNELITLSAANANIAIKNARQLFSKVPGVFVYDMDGSGNQLNISTRGLDPHRSWEFNVRQNGVLINSDMYGYPASHYSAPMESFERIEVIRGTGALQYGAQFGGMINYSTKRPDTAKTFSFESINSAGSFGLLSSYNAISGTVKKFSYYAYTYRRHSNGYRRNSVSEADAQFVQLQYKVSDKVGVKAELGRSKYLYQIPGPLNDSMFLTDPRMSTRSRNFFSPDIYVPSISLNAALNTKTKIKLTASGVFGLRNSVMFDAFANVPDAIDQANQSYKNRQVDIDRFNSRTLEARILHQYRLGNVQSKLATGVVYMNNDLHRRQLGKGTTGTDYDLTLVEPGFGRDIHFKTTNVAMFAENSFQLSSRWVVSPGIRFESGVSKMSGIIKYYTVNELPTTINHHFALFGISSQYILDKENMLYGGFSQAYRPVIFKDIVPASTYEQVDKALKDAAGYNLDAGVRGKIFQRLQYDISVFRLLYNNRMGTLVLQDNSGQSYTYKTNIGNSRTNGVELFLQYKLPVTSHLYAGIFTSTSYMNGRYTDGQVAAGAGNKSIRGNKVEAVPDWISRNGLDILFKAFSCTVLYSYTSSTFSDALNTQAPPASGARGFTPAYSIWDFNASFRANALFTLRAGINNIFNKQYFTKRPTFYPGPGIWPGDGRNLYLTLGIKI